MADWKKRGVGKVVWITFENVGHISELEPFSTQLAVRLWVACIAEGKSVRFDWKQTMDANLVNNELNKIAQKYPQARISFSDK